MSSGSALPPQHRPNDYIVIDGMLCHRRWINQDGARKTGQELEDERARVALEQAARLLLEASK